MLKRLSGSLYFDRYHDHIIMVSIIIITIFIPFLFIFFLLPIIKFLWPNQSQGTLDIQINTRYSRPLF